jgi:hypothetical protein
MQENNKKPNNDQLSELIDSPKDREEMKQEITIINLPDVSDIPGQKNIIPAPLGELADTTASSADEEGENIFYQDNDEDIEENPDSNVSPSEKEDLFIAANDLPGDDESLREAALDDTDNDGTPLNEESFKKNVTSSDLDIPGADLDDEDENVGEEDEENNDYSLGADNDVFPGDQF